MDINFLMKQAKEVQKRMKDAQEEIAKKEYTGSAGGGMVVATLFGNGLMKSIKIDDSLLNKDEKDVLEDLIVASLNDAKNRIESDSGNSIKSITGDIKLPEGFI